MKILVAFFGCMLVWGVAWGQSAPARREPAPPFSMNTWKQQDSMVKAIPPDFQTRSFGFFCRQELKLDKKSVLPVRFRLGSQEQCDKLEGKRR